MILKCSSKLLCLFVSFPQKFKIANNIIWPEGLTLEIFAFVSLFFKFGMAIFFHNEMSYYDIYCAI